MNKKLNILISAYACEPDKGSEPFLGWRWTNEISKHHHVYVITRSNNRESIEAHLSSNPNAQIKFIYVDVNGLLRWYKKGNRGMQLYYYYWQKKAFKVAKELCKKEYIDIVHHLTFGAYTQPTFMWKLGIPFVWGPIGGGEKMPFIKGRKTNYHDWFYELLRNFQMNVYSFFPFTRGALKHASKILVTTEDTLNVIPEKYRYKCELFQSLGIDENFMISYSNRDKYIPSNRIKVLIVGRMIGWKGFDIAIEAFKKVIERHDNIDLYMRGRGQLKGQLLKSCGQHLNKRIFYVDTWLEYQEMYDFYKNHDIFLNCSLHDSGCLALLEAMSAGLPIVTINCGGPKVITTKENAIKVDPKPYYQLTEELAEAIMKISDDETLRNAMSVASKKIISENFMYEKKMIRLGKIYDVLANQNLT